MNSLDEIQKIANLILAAGFVGASIKAFLTYSRVKQENERLKSEQAQAKVDHDKKIAHDHIQSQSDDELSRSSADLYDKLNKKN